MHNIDVIQRASNDIVIHNFEVVILNITQTAMVKNLLIIKTIMQNVSQTANQVELRNIIIDKLKQEGGFISDDTLTYINRLSLMYDVNQINSNILDLIVNMETANKISVINDQLVPGSKIIASVSQQIESLNRSIISSLETSSGYSKQSIDQLIQRDKESSFSLFGMNTVLIVGAIALVVVVVMFKK